jgi:hypothetical protein
VTLLHSQLVQNDVSEGQHEYSSSNSSASSDMSLSMSDESMDDTDINLPTQQDLPSDSVVTVNNRLWTKITQVIVDEASHIRRQKTTIKWPSSLQLGNESCARYFYLMYPMQTLSETLINT